MADETSSSQPEAHFHEAETVPDATVENLHAAPTEQAILMPDWPPIRDYRTQPRVSTPLVVLLILLALALIGTGLSFIIYSANTQYQHSLHTDATVSVQSTRNTLATVQARNQGTTNAQSTAQTNAEATITAQANDSASATATVDSVTATTSAFSDLYSQSTTGTPALDDPLRDNSGKGKWEGETKAMQTGCAFTSDGYHVSEAQQGNFQPCFAQATGFGNMAYRVSMTFTKGNRAQGGILLCADTSKNSYYFFSIGTDSSYGFDLYISNNQATILTSGFSGAIHTALNQANQIAVIANRSHFYLYVNGQYVDDVSDSTFTTGKIGVAIVDTSTPVDAIVSNAQVWNISPMS